MQDDAYKQLNILCVEDESGVRKRIVNTLKYYFKEVFQASNGEEAFCLYENNEIDIILCDVQMPIMDGIDFIKKVRSQDIQIPIVVLTAYSSEEYLLKLINLQIQHYILKPLNAEHLLEGIESAFKGKLHEKLKIYENSYLDLDTKTLTLNGANIILSDREVRFLQLLIIKREGIVNYAHIEEELWSDKPMSQGALKSFLRDLRKKLPYDIINNISQVGYRLDTSSLVTLCDK